MNPARNATAVPRQRLWRQKCVSNARFSFDGPTQYSKSYLVRIGTPMGKMGAYYETVDRYVCGEASAEDLLAAAENSSTRRRHRIDAHYLLGLERLSKSDRQEAVKHFEEIERAGSYLFFSRPLAAYFLKRLRDDPTWPPWIPVKDPAGPSQK